MAAMLHRNKAHLVKDNHHMGSQAATSNRGNSQGISNRVDINNRDINKVAMGSSRPMARLLESARLVLAQ